tara:strand:+ start:85 stop:693 length:609 start_codon:yes stop_codon:yes gene_type:complete
MFYVQDNFLENPYEIRQKALKADYTQMFYAPGYGSWDVPLETKEYILSEVKRITNNSSLRYSPILDDCKFQHTTRDFVDGLYHRDPNSRYFSILYLTLDPPPKTGTEISIYKYPQYAPITTEEWTDMDKLRKKFYENTSNPILRYRYSKVKKRLVSIFSPFSVVANKFNRFLVADCFYYHRAEGFCGTSMKDTRLTLISFFS